MTIYPHEIAFDFDGVVADTFRLFIDIAKSDYNVDINYEDITDYEFLNVVDMDFDDAMKIIDTLTYNPHNMDLRPNQGAEAVLARIARETPLLFVTARPTGWPVEMWFERNMPLIQPGSFTVMATSVNTAKLPILKKQGVAYFVDDRLDTCHLLSSQGITPIVFDQPWNRQPHPFTTVKNWDDISRLINWEDGKRTTSYPAK